MNIRFRQISTVLLSAVSLISVIAFMVTAVPVQAGGYLHFGYGHHEEHGGYGHDGYGYGYPLYYGLHSYREPYTSNDDNYNGSSSSNYRSRDDSRGNSSIWTLLGNNQAMLAHHVSTSTKNLRTLIDKEKDG